MAFSINDVLLEPAKVLWTMPLSVPPTAKCLEKCYFVPVQGFEGFYSSPAPNSLVVIMVNDRAQLTRFKSTPKNKDSKRMHLVGRNIYNSSSLQMWIVNQKSLLSNYDFVNRMAVSKFADQLPEASREEFQVFISVLVAKTSLQSTLDVRDTSATVMALAVSMRRVSWL